MADGFRALRAAARAELEQFNRSRVLVSLVFVEAITFLVLVSLFGLTGSRAPTALIQLDHGPLAQAFVQQLREAHDSFRLHPMTAAKARREIEQGDVVAIVTIPRNFDRRINRGQTVLLPVTVDNVNADMDNDLRGAIPSAITHFGEDEHFPGIRLTPVEHDLIGHDTGYIPYLIVSALALTAWVVAGILGAVAITREFETGTVTQWRLAPVNADMDNDLRGAVPSAITHFGEDHHFPGIRLVPVERDLIDHNTGYIPYLIVSALALTAWVVAGILGAVAITREYEAGTVAQWRLAPVHPGWLLAGKLAAATLVAALAVGATVLVVAFGYGVPPKHPLAALGALAICIPMFTCMGACAGALLRRTLPVAALFFGLALPFYIDSGALEPLRFDGNKIWAIGHTSPVYSAIAVVEWGFHGFSVTPESVPENFLELLAWAAAAVLVAASVLQRRVMSR